MILALVIDDNKSTTDAMVQMLKLWNITARPVLSPGVAMGILSKEIPNIVFLDINMPGVDGFEVLAFLRREPRLATVPVVIATSDDQPQTSKRALAGGANAVLIKPVMADTLEKVLQKIGLI
jgi:two-component system CheB/CheR fusion protein